MPFSRDVLAQGAGARQGGEQFCGAQVGIEPQRRADFQQARLGAQVPGQLFDALIAHGAAHRAEQNAVGSEAAVDGVLRQGFARLFDGANAHQKVLKFELVPEFFAHFVEDGDRAVRDLGADSVAREDCDMFFHGYYLSVF